MEQTALNLQAQKIISSALRHWSPCLPFFQFCFCFSSQLGPPTCTSPGKQVALLIWTLWAVSAFSRALCRGPTRRNLCKGGLAPMAELVYSVCQQRKHWRHRQSLLPAPSGGVVTVPALHWDRQSPTWGSSKCRKWSLPFEMVPAGPAEVPCMPAAPPLKPVCPLDVELRTRERRDNPVDLWIAFRIILPLLWTVVPAFCWDDWLIFLSNDHLAPPLVLSPKQTFSFLSHSCMRIFQILSSGSFLTHNFIFKSFLSSHISL